MHIPHNLETPWLLDEQYVIGALMTRVRIINLLTVPKEQKTADEGVIIDVTKKRPFNQRKPLAEDMNHQYPEGKGIGKSSFAFFQFFLFLYNRRSL